MKCFGSTDKIDGRHEIIAMVWYGRYNTIGIERERVAEGHPLMYSQHRAREQKRGANGESFSMRRLPSLLRVRVARIRHIIVHRVHFT